MSDNTEKTDIDSWLERRYDTAMEEASGKRDSLTKNCYLWRATIRQICKAGESGTLTLRMKTAHRSKP